MNMLNNNNNRNKGLIYDIYGILNDYLIDTNQYIAMNGSYYNYTNFQIWKKWEVAKLEIEGKPYLIVDIDLNRFSYCKYIRHEKIILKSGLNSEDALSELKACSKFLGIDILDMMEYYLDGNARPVEII